MGEAPMLSQFLGTAGIGNADVRRNEDVRRAGVFNRSPAPSVILNFAYNTTLMTVLFIGSQHFR